MSGGGSHFYAPRAINPARQHDMSSYMSASPLSRSTVDLSDVTHEYSPDADADGFRHPGNHHAEHHGEWTPSLLAETSGGSGSSSRPHSKHGHHAHHHHHHPLMHGPSSLGAGVPHARPASVKSRGSFHSDRPDSFTFEHEPDADADGFRHHHEAPASPAAVRALPEGVVPLDPRAGRVILTPSHNFVKPMYSPYKNLDKIPTKSIEDFQDPEELHPHAQMLYGIDGQRAPKVGVPQWMDGEALDYIQEVAEGEQRQEVVSNRPVDTKLPIEPTGKMMAPVGNISGDHQPVPPSRPMKDEERPGIAGAYTKDGEGSAGLPFDAGLNKESTSGQTQERRDSIGEDLTASVETVRNVPRITLADHIKQAQQPRGVESSDQPRDLEREQEQASASTDGVPTGEDDARPHWLRAAELMANNDYQKLQLAGLVTRIPTTEEEDEEFRRAARATLAADGKIKLVRGTSYPSMQEMEEAAAYNQAAPAADDIDDVPPRSAYPVDDSKQRIERFPQTTTSTLPASERNLHNQNPPTNTRERDIKFASETEGPSFKLTDQGAGVVADRVGVNKEAIVGASIPATSLMGEARDNKATLGQGSEPVTVMADEPPQVPRRPTAESDKPAVPRRPASKTPAEGAAPSSQGDAPAVPRRPAGSSGAQAAARTSTDAAPAVPRRPQVQTQPQSAAPAASKDEESPTSLRSPPIAAPKPVVPARPSVGKLAGNSKFAFASALEAKLRSGPVLPGKKKEESTDSTGEEAASATGDADESAKPVLSDARKGRARGPAKRKPAAAPAASAADGAGEEKQDHAEALATCDIGGELTSRFGVVMRSVGIQTGTTQLTLPIGGGGKTDASDRAEEKVTIIHGGSVKHDADQDVVVGADGEVKNSPSNAAKAGDAIAAGAAPIEQASGTTAASSSGPAAAAAGAESAAAKETTEPAGEVKQSDLLAVPTQGKDEIAGGESKVLDRNLGQPAGEQGKSKGGAGAGAGAGEEKEGDWERVDLANRDELEVEP